MLPVHKEEKFIPIGRFSDFLEHHGQNFSPVKPRNLSRTKLQKQLKTRPRTKAIFLHLRVLVQGIWAPQSPGWTGVWENWLNFRGLSLHCDLSLRVGAGEMGISAFLTLAFSFEIRANRFFTLYKILKFLCTPSAFPMHQPRPCLFHGSLWCLLRKLWERPRTSLIRVRFHSCWLRGWGLKLSQYPPPSVSL